ncbi:MAG: hypothetical protein IJT88_00525 [Kiritimatiellae bacterium]|nr:hypothetical protein [Kiritimatiellia bacterium]MBQ9343683.1 hypothetical protein [Kiritimatiellia bacterium]
MQKAWKIGLEMTAAVVCAGLLQGALAQGAFRTTGGFPTSTRPAPTATVPGGVPLVLKSAPEPKKAKSPIYKVSVGTQNASTVDWWQGVVEFETAAEWIDELEFTFYAYVEDPKQGKKLFRAMVTYVNIPKGRHVADCFLHPHSVQRFGAPKATAVIVKINGAVVAQKSSIQQGGGSWWEGFSPIDGVLLNRGQTPFALVDYDLHPTIKPVVPAVR